MQRAKQEPEYPLRLDFVVIYVVLYAISTQHGTTVAGIACVFHINGDALATTPVQFYTENRSTFVVIELSRDFGVAFLKNLLSTFHMKGNYFV
jgi:hypothetical protein